MPVHHTLVDVDTLRAHLGDARWRVVDCRFDLTNPGAGRAAYLEAHVPGAVYVHLDEDLSGPPVTDHGRHPLPTPEALRDLFGRLGIATDTQVVAYDAAGGALAAARLWWLLRYMGHHAAAVLDGGWSAWRESGYETRAGAESAQAVEFRGEPRTEWLVTAERVPEAALLVDAREPARYRGETEPLDPVAGHIPGAVNHYWQQNLDSGGRLHAPEELALRFKDTLGTHAPEKAVFYCGSGVSACQDLLALAHAGLGAARLYAGSWSDWCRDPERAVATGAEKGTF
jgi:thiosulfate/3-mercaptopyruvate sulfurtransferase